MRFAFALLACFLGTGCYVHPEVGDPIPVERVQAALDGWRAMGNPITFQCLTEGDSLTLLVTNEEEVKAACADTSWTSQAMGCTSGGHDWDGHRHTNILLNEALAPDALDETLEHELRHWMSRCTFGDGDNQHRDARVWYEWHGRNIL